MRSRRRHPSHSKIAYLHAGHRKIGDGHEKVPALIWTIQETCCQTMHCTAWDWSFVIEREIDLKSIWAKHVVYCDLPPRKLRMKVLPTTRPTHWQIPSKVELDSGWSSARASPKINSFKCSPVAKRLCAHVLRSPKTINGRCWCNLLFHLSLVRNIPAAYHPPFCVLAHALWNEFFHFRSCELFKCSKLQKRNWMTWPVASRSSHL